MKKEISALLVLAALLAAALLNIHCICGLTDELTALSEASAHAAQMENWAEAEQYAEKAVRQWEASEGYTHIVLRHAEIDAVSDSLYEMMERMAAGENADEAVAASQMAIYHLKSISGMERIRLGSIF